MGEKKIYRKTLNHEDFTERNRLMDQTPELFNFSQFYQIQFDEDEKEDKAKREQAIKIYTISRFTELYCKAGYNITLEPLALALGVTENYIQKSILPFTKHIIAPKYSGIAFLDNELFPELSMLERQLLKFKKCFINKADLINYLSKNLVKVETVWEDEEDKVNDQFYYAEHSITEQEIERMFFSVAPESRKFARMQSKGKPSKKAPKKKNISAEAFLEDIKLVRKADLKDLALQNKIDEMTRKAKAQVLLIADPLIREIELKKIKVTDLREWNITVKDLEVDNYIEKENLQRFHLYTPERPKIPSALFLIK